MKNIDGRNYSIVEFENYALRVMIEAFEIDGTQHNITIYTTEIYLNKISKVLNDLFTDKIDLFKIVHTATYEQDQRTSEFLDEILKDF